MTRGAARDLNAAGDLAAWHEAGHAFVAWRLSGSVRCVTLESELDGLEGHVEVEWPGSLSAGERAKRSACVAIGGPCAELLRDGGGPDELAHALATGADATWWADYETFERELKTASEETTIAAETLRLDLLTEVRELLEGPAAYECIARIVDALEAHETLDETLFVDAVA